METWLLALVFHIAVACIAKVAQHACESLFLNGIEIAIGDIECCAVEMARLLDGIDIASAQTLNMGDGAGKARDTQTIIGVAYPFLVHLGNIL